MGMEGIPDSHFRNAKRLLEDFVTDESSAGKAPSSEEMAKGLRTVLAAAALYSAAPSEAAARSVHVKSHETHAAHAEKFSHADFDALAKNVFYESRNQSPEGQVAVAQVTLARLLSKRWGASLHDVVYAKNQFSWTREKHKELSGPQKVAVQQLADVFARRFKGRHVGALIEELSKITGLPASTLYYKRADWDESDPNETRMSERTKQVFQSLIWVKNIDDHAFYIEAPRERIAQNR